MSKNYFHTLIIEDDPFASDIMMMLLSRDFRTQVTGELSNQVNISVFDSLSKLREAKKIHRENLDSAYFNLDPRQPVDVVLLDTETPWNPSLPIEIMKMFSVWQIPPKVLCTCTYPNEKLLQMLSEFDCFSGYLVKSDILYCIASAVCLAGIGYTLITPKVDAFLSRSSLSLKNPNKVLIINSRNDERVRSNSKTRLDLLRLKFIFNLPHSEIEDELCIDGKRIEKEVSKKYSKLRISKIKSKEVTVEELLTNKYLDNYKIVYHYKNVMKDGEKRRVNDKEASRFRHMDSLAFHLMTIPNIEKWRE